MPYQTHIFNPQNDLALANGSPTFTSPASANQLANAGACLPIWYGEPGDNFIGGVNADWFRNISAAFNLNVTPTMRVKEGFLPVPWGWSPQIRRYLEDFGFDKNLLPSVEKIEGWRLLSSRITGAEIISTFISDHKELTEGVSEYCIPRIFSEPEEALSAVESKGNAMIKLPWSNAGRGQQVSERTTPEELRQRIYGMINRQGAVEITPFYNKILDFAMLWENGRFTGYSLFQTDTHGGWKGNNLWHDSKIEKLIEVKAGISVDFEKIIDDLSRLLMKFSQKFEYDGCVGVDFIIGTIGNSQNILMLPVEINWRRTMGHVAHRLKNSFLGEDTEGSFQIIPSQLLKSSYNNVANCKIGDNRLIDGVLDIVPPGGDFRFILNAKSQRAVDTPT